MKKRILSLVMALCMAAALMVPAWAAGDWSDALGGLTGGGGVGGEKLYIYLILNSASSAKNGVVTSEDGSDVPTYQKWVTPAVMADFQKKLDTAQAYFYMWDSIQGDATKKNEASAAALILQNAIPGFKNAQRNGYLSDTAAPLPEPEPEPEPKPEPPVELPFTDVDKDAWYYDFVCRVYEKKLFAGFDAKTFSPATEMTYGQFLAVLNQFSGEAVNTAGTANWYDGYVAWAKDKGLIPANLLEGFDPTAAITRQDMAAIFGTFLEKYQVSFTPVNNTAASFTDLDKIDDYAAAGVAICWQAGIMGGRTDGSFDPDSTAQRCEVAVTMVQMARVMGK